MAHREVGQLSLADGLVGGRRRVNDLDRIAASIDWSALAGVLSEVYASRRGRPAYPPVALLRCLLLQQWYSLSDPGTEEALSDRLSFRRFVGLSLDDDVPDHSTLSRFRDVLVARGLGERVFEEVNRQLEAAGLMVKRGTLIDASLIAADARPRHRELDSGRGRTLGTLSDADPDARWTVKRGRSTFGYKAHVAVDEGSGLIRRSVMTPANVHDSVPADGLILGDEAAVYADSAYAKEARRADLAARGIEDGIMRRNHRGRPLGEPERRRNGEIARVRSAVERLFGLMKRHYRYTRVRYRSLRRNAAHLHLLCIAINLRRAVALGA